MQLYRPNTYRRHFALLNSSSYRPFGRRLLLWPLNSINISDARGSFGKVVPSWFRGYRKLRRKFHYNSDWRRVHEFQIYIFVLFLNIVKLFRFNKFSTNISSTNVCDETRLYNGARLRPNNTVELLRWRVCIVYVFRPWPLPTHHRPLFFTDFFVFKL